MTGTLTIELLSDACFSVPATVNVAVDTEACTDELGLPRIPGKTIRGLLRDSWLSASPGLDPDQSRGYALLGKPRDHQSGGALRIGDAMMSAGIRDRIAWALGRPDNALGQEEVREAFFDSRVLTKIDRVTGAPETDTLRGVRVVPRGTKLYAPITALETVDREFLDMLLALTRHAGLDRNRGMGHVRMSAKWSSLSPLQASDADLPVKGELLHYRLVLTAPCLLHAQALDPNSCATLHHIPGSTIRGAVAAALQRQGDQDGMNSLIAGGTVEFLNAYPEVDGMRSIPTPCTWQQDKRADLVMDAEIAKANPADSVPHLFFGEKTSANQRQALAPKYVAVDVGEFTPAKAEVAQSVHQVRQRATGTSQKGESTVFVYVALSPGQAFRGCIRAPRERHAKLKAVLEGSDLLLGRSVRAGYGGAPQVEIIAPTFAQDELDRPSLPTFEKDEVLEVWLTSDAIVRDERTGQHDPGALGEAIRERFGSKAELVSACVRAGTVQGYVRQWRTGLPAVPCAAAGSVVVMRAVEPIQAEEVARAQAEPIGERASDGFGRTVVCPMPPNGNGGLNVRSARGTDAPKEPVGKPGAVELEAQRQLYHSVAKRLLTDLATELAGGARSLISSSLAQRLRSPLRAQGWEATYETWFGSGDGTLRSTAMDPVKRCRVHDARLPDFILRVCNKDWRPGGLEAKKMQCRLVPLEDAERIWAEVLRGLRGLFLEVLLGQLARRGKKKLQRQGQEG